MLVTVWVKPVPKDRLPLLRIRSPALRLLVESVTPPVPFTVNPGSDPVDLGIKVWADDEVKAKVPVPGVIAPPERKSALPELTVRVLDEKEKVPV